MSHQESAPSANATTKETWPECVRCRSLLPLGQVQQGKTGKEWICVRCDAPPGIATKATPQKDSTADAAPSAVIQAKRVRSTVADGPQGSAKKAVQERTSVTCTIDSKHSRDLDRLGKAGHLSVHSKGSPFAQSVQKHGAHPYDPNVEQELVSTFESSLDSAASLARSLEEGKGIAPQAHESIARDTLLQATQDLDLFVKLGVNPLGDSYPGRHSLHVAMLAAGIGATIGWDHKTLVDLGVGCLIHDLGMVLVPNKVYQSSSLLDEGEFGAVAAHPLYTFDLLEDHMSRVPLASRMVAYQIHERCDGSGYPRQRRAPLMHEAAKLAAVADVYIALVSPRPHRPALMPYYAVEHLLFGARNGQFDAAAVRALIKTISLFPIGSYVKLSDHRRGKVLRCNPADYANPIIEAWRPNELDAAPDIVDLSAVPGLSIASPLARLDTA